MADRDKPQDVRPALVGRFVTCREYRQVRRLLIDAEKASDEEVTIDKSLAAIGMILVGWRNVGDADGRPVEYSIGKLESVLTLDDVIELVEHLVIEMRLSENEKKVSALRRQSTGGNSAESTAKASA
ncbi:MAG TPA: hypothetical protein VGN72_00195 [Tepidisphaeraceae bacterium]|jgi:hypothetical protein|nr:hypothetical protein [Tepidisphaeraceae bacterium]